MIIVLSNRNVNEERTDESLFGEQANSKGLGELRVANAEKNGERWRVKLLPEDQGGSEAPSETRFKQVIKEYEESKQEVCPVWVFHIHGHNTSFLESLNEADAISRLYGVNVLLFSWPSNVYGDEPWYKKLAEYKKTRINAEGSSYALDRSLEKLGRYMNQYRMENCPFVLNLLAYSHGNHLLEAYIRSPHYDHKETLIFSNIVLCQADVDGKTHLEWITKMGRAKKLYITLNENDFVLNVADKAFQPKRLGQQIPDEKSPAAIYVDFTDAPKVGRIHQLFETAAEVNKTVKNFFQAVLTGRNGERVQGLIFNRETGAYEAADRRWDA